MPNRRPVRLYSFLITLALLALPPAAGAVTLGPEIQVSVSTVDTVAVPQVAVFPDGGFIVVWEASPRPTGKAARVYTRPTVLHARLFTAGGEPASGEYLLALPATFGRLDGIAAAGNDRFAVVWDFTSPNSKTYLSEVFVQMFHRNGTPLTQPILAHEPSANNRYFGIVTSAPDGDVAVAWAADQGDPALPGYFNNADARVFSNRLVPLTGELTLGTGAPSDGSGPFPDSLAIQPDGSLVASLTYAGDSINVYAAHVSAAGKYLSIDSVFPTGNGPCCVDNGCCDANTWDSSLAMAPDGSFTIALDFMPPAPADQLPLPASPPSPILGRFFDAAGTAQDATAIQMLPAE